MPDENTPDAYTEAPSDDADYSSADYQAEAADE